MPARPSTKLGTLKGEERTTTARRRSVEVSKLAHLLKGDLDWIVMKCLEKDRTRRYETANGVAAELKRYLNNEPVVARPPSTAYRFQKTFRRNKLVFVSGAAVVAALVGALAFSGWSFLRERGARFGEQVQRLEAEAQRKTAEAAQKIAETEQHRADAQARKASESQRQSRQLLYASDMNLAQQALAAGNLQRARFLLDRHRPGTDLKAQSSNLQSPGDLRGWEWRYLWQLCRGNALFKLYQQPLRVMFAGFSSDGQHVATSDDTGKVGLWDLTTKAESSRLQNPVVIAAESGLLYGTACLSDDGEWMAAVSRDGTGTWGVKVWNIATRQLMAEFSTGGVSP
ncbi:MAG: hypothetical protein ACRD5L_07115, partial [Bryobacteraceae bacterium]